jgi:hypothetical protein
MLVHRSARGDPCFPLRRVALAAAPLAAAALVTASVASANTLTAGTTPILVPDHPFFNDAGANTTACNNEITASENAGSINYPDAEVEPFVAVDPQNSSHLVAAFQQDRWNDGGDNGDVAVFSSNGGTNWSLSSNQAKFTICEGGTFDRASDPSVAWSSDGSTVYQAALGFNANGPAFGGASSVQVSTSGDSGTTWGNPVVVQQDNSTTVLNDKEWVTADPSNSSKAYLVWDRLVSPSTHANPDAFVHTPAFRGPTLFSKTIDGGSTWSPTRVIFDPGQFNQTIDNEITVVPAGSAQGTLVDGFTLIRNKPFKPGHNPFSVAVIRSTDGGATWSGPTTVSPLVDAPVSIKGQPVRTGDILPQFTADPATGRLYVAWQDGSFSPTGQAKIAFSQSSDGGKTWSTPVRIDDSPGDIPAFTPQISVNSDGTIGVSYYDLENATTSHPDFTDEFIVHCHAATVDCTSGANWTAGGETRLSTSGSFDMFQAPFAEGFFVGDYEGLTASATTFDPFFVMATPIATAGPTDPFFNTAG